jgi:hypothetical protein
LRRTGCPMPNFSAVMAAMIGHSTTNVVPGVNAL